MNHKITSYFSLNFCKVFIVVSLLLVGLAKAAQSQDKGAEKEKIKALTDVRKKLAHRRRRIIVNDDGNQTVYSLKEANREELLSKRSAGLANTQVDTLFYCTWSSGFGQFTHNTKVGQIFDTKACPPDAPDGIGFSKNKAGDFIKQGTDCLQIQIDFCRKNNIEIFWSMRMNDTHDGADQWWYHPYMFPKLKSEHLEWLVGSKEKKPPHGSWTAVDYAKPQIRDLAFKYVEEVCKNYDIDGVELDFFRHLVYFRAHAWGSHAGQKERDMMTDMLRHIRRMTEQVGIKRGKPILLSVRVPDSVGYCNVMGIDIERWLAEGLIDMLVTTGYFRLNDWRYSVELGHKYDVPVYPCLSDPRIGPAESRKARKSMDCYRARAMNVWASGADGVYLFNYGDPNSCLWNQIGEPKILEKLDKIYCISARDVSKANRWLNKGWAIFLNRPWWGPNYPLPLRQGEVIIFYINVGEDISGQLAKGIVPDIKLRLWVKNIPGAKVLTVVLNDHVLQNRPLSSDITLTDEVNPDEWFEYDVDPAIMIKGKNRIKLTLWECDAKDSGLADVLMWVRHPGKVK